MDMIHVFFRLEEPVFVRPSYRFSPFFVGEFDPFSAIIGTHGPNWLWPFCFACVPISAVEDACVPKMSSHCLHFDAHEAEARLSGQVLLEVIVPRVGYGQPVGDDKHVEGPVAVHPPDEVVGTTRCGRCVLLPFCCVRKSWKS